MWDGGYSSSSRGKSLDRPYRKYQTAYNWFNHRLHAEGVSNKHIEQNVYWILFELLWRDFFFFTSERFSHLSAFNKRSKHSREELPLDGEAGTSSTLFDLAGFEGVLKPGESRKKIREWKTFNLADSQDRGRLFLEGRTGIPMVDANMRELAMTGYMSNRGRQNVASFLTVDL
jgi:deoxyribodipyrimidine photo-lyase